MKITRQNTQDFITHLRSDELEFFYSHNLLNPDSIISRKKSAEKIAILNHYIINAMTLVLLAIVISHSHTCKEKEHEYWLECEWRKEKERLDLAWRQYLALEKEIAQKILQLEQEAHDKYLKQLQIDLRMYLELINLLLIELNNIIKKVKYIYHQATLTLIDKTHRHLNQLPSYEIIFKGETHSLKQHIQSEVTPILNHLKTKKITPNQFVSRIGRRIQRSKKTFVDKLNPTSPQEKEELLAQVSPCIESSKQIICTELKKEEAITVMRQAHSALNTLETEQQHLTSTHALLFSPHLDQLTIEELQSSTAKLCEKLQKAKTKNILGASQLSFLKSMQSRKPNPSLAKENESKIDASKASLS